MVLKLHQILKEAGDRHSYLCWINEKPTLISPYMIMQGDPSLEAYFGSYMLGMLKSKLVEKNGNDHVAGSIRGHYRLETNRNQLQVTDTFPADYAPVNGLEKKFQEARAGEELTFDRTKIFEDRNLHYCFQPKKRESKQTPKKIYVRKDYVDYLQEAYQKFSEMKISYAFGVYFHDDNVIAGISRVNLSLP